MLLANNTILGEIALPGSSPHTSLLPGRLLQAGVPRHIVARRDLDVSLQKSPPLCLPLTLERHARWEEGWLRMVDQVAVQETALVSCLLPSCLPLQHPCCLPASCLEPHCHPRFLCHTSAHATSMSQPLLSHLISSPLFTPHSNFTHSSHLRHVLGADVAL